MFDIFLDIFKWWKLYSNMKKYLSGSKVLSDLNNHILKWDKNTAE